MMTASSSDGGLPAKWARIKNTVPGPAPAPAAAPVPRPVPAPGPVNAPAPAPGQDAPVVPSGQPLFGRGRARAPPPVLAANPPLVGVPPVTVPDPETSKDWGDTKDPGDGAEGWNTKPVRKRPLSGEHQEGRGHKEAPSIPLDNRYGALAGSEEGAEFCTDMDLSLESPLPFPDSWVAENILEAVDMDQTPHGVGDVGGAGAP
ncbi:hypothetical protein AAFF_G00151520 [Aldrovandia affinis]|uniref:Uncharacterized protein n=1 Tax=Aldrovandia affinis TaxID=143900 RepID=A0AAD7R0T4_9TELE|nr:hypothetical protein AAFF_G00151520 [Aldrovandia affinis]